MSHPVVSSTKAAKPLFVKLFPPTDAEARGRLLGAIRKNSEQYLPIHTVLGPNTSSDDSRRLRGLLEHAMAGVRKPAALLAPQFKASVQIPQRQSGRWYSLEQQPLWTEDFFSVVDRRSLVDPYALILP